MKLFHLHRWEIIHPAYYQDYVRAIACGICGKQLDRGVMGENGVLPWHFHATTLKTLSG